MFATQTNQFTGYRFRNTRQIDTNKIGLCEGKTPPNCLAITGQAGTGKTFSVREQMRNNPSYCQMSASTGIAAINLGGDIKTIHSLLHFFNEESIKKAYERGYLQENIATIASKGYEYLGIDEMSMFSSIFVDYITEAIADVNDILQTNLGLILVGDFLQLPPVPDNNSNDPRTGEFAFKGRAWKHFDGNIVKLEKIWRQDNPEFIHVMNYLRAGRGKEAVELMQKLGIEFKSKLDKNYDGTTLIAVNRGVDEYNRRRLDELPGKLIGSTPKKRGTQLKEWDKQIPMNLWVKNNAYVMLLANDTPRFRWVNGDCGYIRDYDSSTEKFTIELVRTKQLVEIGKVHRYNTVEKEPDASAFSSMYCPYLDNMTGQWVIGEIEYHPIRLAWATSIHKSQGLSLDKVQVESTERFFGAPSMAYVAVSRARTPENLIIVGSPTDFMNKVKVNSEVRRWI